VYSRIHVGNARPYVIPMLLRRFLAHEGYEPTVVINLTDVNDKIYDAAHERGVPSGRHAAEMVDGYVADTDALGLGRPDSEPKATETIGPIIGLIEDLVASGHAYESGCDVYFRVRSFTPYGELSNRDPDTMDQGEEAGSAELKEDRLDFALWKARKPDEDTSWPSPWGEGRPGWHIECSAMAEELLGLEFAIHGGGSDLVFPHHENERAQTEAARERPLARVWMHNGMVEARHEAGAKEKMAKSVGNVFLLGEAIGAHGATTVVGFLVGGHYRQPLAFSEAALEEAAARNQRIREFLREAEDPPGKPSAAVLGRREAFLEALADDFNTPRALAELFGLIADARRTPEPGARAVATDLLTLLGLESLAKELPAGGGDEAERLLAEREEARAGRDFERADAIRDRLGELGWEVRDGADGARLVRRDS
ncbi:MAG TPA: cysteine--tRNA ligase, partial [Solirubrobacterales bacterium]|nr:cysteine--tRNA ligase [Solirubrobacterales bacterium]